MYLMYIFNFFFKKACIPNFNVHSNNIGAPLPILKDMVGRFEGVWGHACYSSDQKLFTTK